MVLFENIHIGNCRSESKSAFRLSPFRSPILLIGTLTAFLIHVMMMNVPIGNALLSTEPADLKTWGMLIALSFTVLVAMEIHKFSRSQSFGNRQKNK
jgi:magnesium-transporting ATPase (P-type)